MGYLVLQVDVAYGGFEVIPSPGLRQGISCKGESVPCWAFRIIYHPLNKGGICQSLTLFTQRFYLRDIAGKVVGSTKELGRILASVERHARCCGGHCVGIAGHVAGGMRLPCARKFRSA